MVIVLVVILALGVIPIWGIIDAALRPDPVWAAAGQNKVVWIIVQVFLGVFGTVAYFVAVRPRLIAVTPPAVTPGPPPSALP